MPKTDKKTGWDKAFTLAELLVVIVILTTAVMVIIPYATHRNHNQAISDAIQDMADTVRYAMQHASSTKTPIRFVLNCDRRVFRLEQAKDLEGRIFVPLEGVPGSTRHYSEILYVTDIEGFELLDQGTYALILNAEETGPHANLTIASERSAQQLSIEGPNIEITKLLY